MATQIKNHDEYECPNVTDETLQTCLKVYKSEHICDHVLNLLLSFLHNKEDATVITENKSVFSDAIDEWKARRYGVVSGREYIETCAENYHTMLKFLEEIVKLNK